MPTALNHMITALELKIVKSYTREAPHIHYQSQQYVVQ